MASIDMQMAEARRKEAEKQAEVLSSFDEGVDTTLEAMSTLLNKLQVPTLQQALSDIGLDVASPRLAMALDLIELNNGL